MFTEEQTKKRFAICRTALTNNKQYSLRLKKIYRSQQEIEQLSIIKSDNVSKFTDNYFVLAQRGWGGEYFEYDKTCATEGGFYPFVRTRFRSHQPIDEGCIWIGALDSYPLIYVANTISIWVCPYSIGGFIRTEPFLPYHEAMKILPRLANRKIYPDLDVQLTY
ncbi:MAG: hypothetical protein RLZZ289_1742 [Bacteroidota bacterium]